ncbi:MAG: DivIVA domain-containing protein [Rhodothermales bacterium]
MKLSSLDIRKQEFSRSLRGYDLDEVDAFLNLISTQWQELTDELRRSEEKVREQQLKLDHYMKVEEALEEALKTARSSARQTLEHAEKRASDTLKESESRAQAILREAESERHAIRLETTRFKMRHKEVVAKLRAFLMSEMEMLAHHDAEEGRPLELEGSRVEFQPEPDSRPAPAPLRHAEPEQEDEPEQESRREPEPGIEQASQPEAVHDGVGIEDDEDTPSWKINDVFTPETHEEDADDGDEIRKIRRILDAMDDEDDARSV